MPHHNIIGGAEEPEVMSCKICLGKLGIDAYRTYVRT